MENKKTSTITLSALQAVHAARQEEWCPDQKPDLSFRGNELAGEVGEACNIIKKLERERHGWRGSRATIKDLEEELADVIHCACLVAITAGIDLERAAVAKFNATSEKNGLTTIIRNSASDVGVGMAIAAGIIMSGHGEDSLAAEILRAAGGTDEATLKAWGVDDYDIKILRPILTKSAGDEDELDCPVCATPFKPEDICATDIEMGTCHAACLEGSPVVNLDSGEVLPDSEIDTFQYGDAAEAPQ
ncbi:MazG-like family protein [Agrobacterium vitis]|uniref:MazG-like family protein n=1 Tax=Agrobacterium vitis TaxID=373 RepID=UPI0018D1F8D6|nr:MazG-like family protein [Agrobacterium vitis]